MQKNQYQQYKKLIRIRDMVIVAVLIFVGIFYYLGLSEEEKNEPEIYRAETVLQAEEQSAASGTEKTGEGANVVPEGTATVTVAAEGVSVSEGSVSETSTVTTAAESLAGTVAALTPETAVADGRINLNTATLEELDSLPGIGPATAKLILEYRQQYGGFATPEEIKNVKRIGDKTYEKLKDHIRV